MRISDWSSGRVLFRSGHGGDEDRRKAACVVRGRGHDVQFLVQFHPPFADHIFQVCHCGGGLGRSWGDWPRKVRRGGEPGGPSFMRFSPMICLGKKKTPPGLPAGLEAFTAEGRSAKRGGRK